MDEDILRFFDSCPAVLPLFERLHTRILGELAGVSVKVSKTQISYRNRYGFAFVSLPFRRVKGRPEHYIIFSFGLGQEMRSPRIVQAVEPYPGRWTHHVILSCPEEIDEELIGWVRDAYFFSLQK